MADKTPTPEDWQAAERLWERAEAAGARNADAFLATQGEVAESAAALFHAMWESAHGQTTQAMDRAVSALVGDAVNFSHFGDLIGRRLGNYRLSSEVGSGGAGAVYAGQRVGDAEHEAAVKVLFTRLHPGSPASRAFVREQRLLSKLSHPYIAQYIDSGISEDGLAYVVVELVRGPTLKRFVDGTDGQHPDANSVLRLLEQVCLAVAFAHRHLIVHRDLKPSNILVDTDTGTPKLLDFGIAKQLAHDDEGEAHTTTFACTPDYASPEQLARSEVIGTATDIYSLGCILHELAFGRTPLGDQGLDVGERLTAMRSRRTPRLGTRNGADWCSKLNQGQRRDLQRLIDRCLAHDPGERYPGAATLAADIARIADNQPISIGRQTVGYRLGRYFARHRALVIASAAAMLALLVGATAHVLQSRETATQARRLQSVTSVLGEMLTRPDPYRGNREARLVDVVDDVLPRLDSGDGLDPDVRADIEDMLGQTLLHLGRYDDAERLTRRALAHRQEFDGQRAASTLSTRLHLALIDLERGHYQVAHQAAEGIVSDLHAQPTADSAVLTRALRLLATTRIHHAEDFDAAIAAIDEALAMHDAARTRNRLEALLARQVKALALSQKGDLSAAEAEQQHILVDMTEHLGPQSPYLFDARNNLGRTLQKRGRMDEAGELLSKNARFAEQVFGEDAPDTLMAWNNLGVLRFGQGDYPVAAALFERVADGRERVLGGRHPRTLIARSNLADALTNSGDTDRACPMAWDTYQLSLEVDGPDSHRPGYPLKVYARCLGHRGDPEKAVETLDQVISLWRSSRGPHHFDTLNAMHDRAFFLDAAGHRQQAIAQLDEEIALREAHYALDHPNTERARTLRAELGSDPKDRARIR
ncbi:MAG: serine/threonine-protein kinase [Lysobacteraceae bacterium]